MMLLIKESLVDSTQVAISDLPIQMEGTDYLIHPVGDLRVYERGTKIWLSVSDLSFTISNYGENEITGYLQNLKFQKPILIRYDH
jgi:hypothetical protein